MTENERMNSVKDEIKPCLCGTVLSLVYEKVGYYDDRLYFSIHCEKCGIKMEGTPHSPFLAIEEKIKYEEEIVEKWNAWNKRAKRIIKMEDKMVKSAALVEFDAYHVAAGGIGKHLNWEIAKRIYENTADHDNLIDVMEEAGYTSEALAFEKIMECENLVPLIKPNLIHVTVCESSDDYITFCVPFEFNVSKLTRISVPQAPCL